MKGKLGKTLITYNKIILVNNNNKYTNYNELISDSLIDNEGN